MTVLRKAWVWVRSLPAALWGAVFVVAAAIAVWLRGRSVGRQEAQQEERERLEEAGDRRDELVEAVEKKAGTEAQKQIDEAIAEEVGALNDPPSEEQALALLEEAKRWE